MGSYLVSYEYASTLYSSSSNKILLMGVLTNGFLSPQQWVKKVSTGTFLFPYRAKLLQGFTSKWLTVPLYGLLLMFKPGNWNEIDLIWTRTLLLNKLPWAKHSSSASSSWKRKWECLSRRVVERVRCCMIRTSKSSWHINVQELVAPPPFFQFR